MSLPDDAEAKQAVSRDKGEDEMNSQQENKGYDDRFRLREMAIGVVTRRFGSVDEAAKSVLGEEAGSNVDRLRRKFREQQWYERGLKEYVDAEIERRSSGERDTSAPITWTRKSWDLVVGQFTPTAVMASAWVMTTAYLSVAVWRPVDLLPLFYGSFALTYVMTSMLASRLGKSAKGWQLVYQPLSLALTFLAMTLAFSHYVPHEGHILGSGHAALLAPLAGGLMSIYATEAVIRSTGKSQPARKGERRLGCALIILCYAMSYIPLGYDLASLLMRMELGASAMHSIAEARRELEKKYPSADLRVLTLKQKEIIEDAIRIPSWRSGQ